jgi:tRNA threonylcarbamoyladenosine modification (KEOPS) complex  Pcc1 subunit
MKQTFVILALLIALPVVYLIRNHANYGEALPPGLPADIPIVEGQVISGRRTLFEDGRGYVVDIRSDLSYREVLQFYAERVVNGRLTDAPGMGTEFSVADFRLDGKRILLEIHAREATTYVTMAIHLGKWW